MAHHGLRTLGMLPVFRGQVYVWGNSFSLLIIKLADFHLSLPSVPLVGGFGMIRLNGLLAENICT